MPLANPTPIDALPPSPTTADGDAFDAVADAFLGAFPTLRDEINASTAATYGNAVVASESGLAAQQAAIAAEQSVAAAAAAAGAVKWISGTAYAEGVVTWSPANYLNYRRKAAGAGAIDPSLDAANWALIGAPLAAPIQSIATNTTAVAGMHYLITAPLTLTLPASPTVRDTVRFTNLTGLVSTVIDPNGALIRGVAGAMNLDFVTAAATLTYSGATKGWV